MSEEHKKMASNSWTANLYCRILLILAFLVSWAVYLVGFCLLLLTWPEEQEDSEKNTISLSKTDLSLYPFYATLIGGPILCLIGILHTVLTGTKSSVFGTISTVLSTIYFVCASHVVYMSGSTVTNDPYTAKSDSVSPIFLLILVGVVAEALCWISVMTATVTRYKFSQTEENSNNEQRLNYEEQIKLSCQPFSPGFARKLSVPFIALSATGWLILASRINLDGHEEIYEVGAFYVGPLLFLIALLHSAGCSERMGVLTYVLSMFYVMLMGAGVISYGEAIRLQQYHNKTHTNYCVMLAGSIMSLVFWTCVLVLGQFYHTRPQGRVQGVGKNCSAREKRREVNAG